ncbi:MAG: Riboflavin biosynthesis protein RibF [Chloroflexi bacterium ADurb.Bin325]|nr:MAG: Riboflavin biosynthesis protein RibF [Chloroflexi bacterium ADurb.Bin325]
MMDTYLGFPQTPFEQPVFLTIGNFDGVHRGHQMLVTDLARAAHAAGGLAGLLTFEPHPLAVLRPAVRILRLTSNEERAAALAALGLDFVIVLPFTSETAATPAADFMQQIVRRLPLRELWVGPDFALGRGREGNAARLAELGQTLGYRVRVVAPYDWQGEPVRSSRVRSLLTDEGAVEAAADLLGRPYQVWGEVALGARRGHTIGFPTANLALPEDRLVPARGVYACWAWHDAAGYPAAVNIGVRPSFDNGQPTIEAYLLDFDGDLYGETVGLSFIHRLRGEKRFADIAALIAQIGADAETTRRLLADPPTHADPPGQRPWQELVHTADWAIRVAGADPRNLFANAAAAMYALQEADPAQPVTLARAVRAEADGWADLLVAWLNRLLFSQELAGEMYTRFELFELSERGLAAVAYGYRGAPAHTSVKAVTYYDLAVEETAEGWRAQVTFDV